MAAIQNPALAIALAAAGLISCIGQPAIALPGKPQHPAPLQSTTWRLIEIRSMEDAQGPRRPADPSRYTLELQPGGRAVLQLDCNRASGSWSAEPGTDLGHGRFRFGPLATTRALCPPPSLGETLTVQLPEVWNYRLWGDQLSLSLKADAGELLFEALPDAEVRFGNTPDPALEAVIRRNAPGYRRSVVGDTQERWARYVHAATDLDNDGRKEVLVFLMGSFFCGTGGCTLQVYRSIPGGYALVSNFPITRLPVVVAGTRNNGWLDLWRLESGGGAPSTYVRHGFDGQRYRETERIPAEPGLPKGLVVLTGHPTFTEGIQLRPAG